MIKSSALNDKIFRQLYQENETEIERLLFILRLDGSTKQQIVSLDYILFLMPLLNFWRKRTRN